MLLPFAQAAPKGALEPNHMKLLAVLDGKQSDKGKQKEEEKSENLFKEVLGRPRVSIDEEMESEHRPNLGEANMLSYFANVAKNVNSDNAAAMLQGLVIGAVESRIVFEPHKKQEERTEHDGVKTGNMLLVMVGAAASVALLKAMREQQKEDKEEAKVAEEEKPKYSDKLKRNDTYGYKITYENIEKESSGRSF
jgi:hypothetical protein